MATKTKKETEKKVEEKKEQKKKTAPAKKEKKVELKKFTWRQRLGAKLLNEEPLLSPKVKKAGEIVAGGLAAAGAAVGAVVLKQHMGGAAGDDALPTPELEQLSAAPDLGPEV